MMRFLGPAIFLRLQVLLSTLALANREDLTDENRLLSQHGTPSRFNDPESSSAPNTTFLVTAVLNSPAPPYHAMIECWALAAPFATYPTVGKALSLGETSNATYVVLPPRSGEGWHRPPANM